MSAVRTLSDVTPDVAVIIPSVSQADHLARCLESLLIDTSRRWSIEIVVVANGATERVRAVARAAAVRVVESPVNRGFAGGCNLGARHTTGQRLLLLNDDVIVRAGWLDPLIETLGQPGVGAVGPLVRYPDGRVQEVGSVLWQDGSSRPIGHGQIATAVEPLVRRRVDYCSAAALLIDRAAWDAVGGLDEAYHPAYYEDVDFALRLERVGLQVWVDPRSEVAHVESESSTARFKQFLFARHRARLVATWPAALATRLHPTAHPDLASAMRMAIRRVSSARAHALVVDDRVPRYGLGSGFDRMVDVLLELRQADVAVTCVPTAAPAEFDPMLAEAGVVVSDDCSPSALARLAGEVDCVIASRPNNAQVVCEALGALARRPRVVYDAEALYHRRVERQASLASGPEADALWREARRWREIEDGLAGRVDTVVCVSSEEAQYFLERGASDVRVLTPWLRRARLTPPTLAGRSDIGLVAGWLAGDGSPNVDGLRWFATSVLPHVLRRMPWVRLRVTGCPPESLVPLKGPSIRFEGFVADLRQFYSRVRVVAVPARYGSGVKLKTLEALQHGVPVVSTPVGAEGMPGVPPLDVHDDPEAYADALVHLLTEAPAWRSRRTAIDHWLAHMQAGRARDWADVVLCPEGGAGLVRRAI